MPGAGKIKAKAIVASLKTQLSYAMSGPERETIIKAYMEDQKEQTIAAPVMVAAWTAFAPCPLSSHPAKSVQTKGRMLWLDRVFVGVAARHVSVPAISSRLTV